ncbi:MAG: Crp/Fnr family transcriptional regulator [Deltaproteobacteria bacterium]|nr:Crp/Fnr family transcriptional regulator [Deltaproteobacteria bacterium]MBW2385602.1 Crp/Fnr family transcriptional regulator [Deltaproteobacteria bacterium]MBW2697719.1 Crp/Fnr family transcriptional regulator [Deltaproteobacteria bacterium]
MVESTQIQVRNTYEREFEDGALIFEEGDAGDVLFVIQAGEIELSRQRLGGRRTVARLGPGEFFGEMSVVIGEGRTTRARAIGSTRLLELDGETLEAMCIERPEVAIRIIRRLTSRLIESERRLAALGIDDLLRPVVRALVRDAVPDPEHGIRIPTSLRRLAADAGLSLLEAHRAIHQLLDQKRVRLVEDVLVARDLDSLSACLEAPA